MYTRRLIMPLDRKRTNKQQPITKHVYCMFFVIIHSYVFRMYEHNATMRRCLKARTSACCIGTYVLPNNSAVLNNTQSPAHSHGDPVDRSMACEQRIIICSHYIFTWNKIKDTLHCKAIICVFCWSLRRKTHICGAAKNITKTINTQRKRTKKNIRRALQTLQHTRVRALVAYSEKNAQENWI